MLSSDDGAVSPPRVNIGSSIVTVVEFTVVVVPLTIKSPSTITSPVTCTLGVFVLLPITIAVEPEPCTFTACVVSNAASVAVRFVPDTLSSTGVANDKVPEPLVFKN